VDDSLRCAGAVNRCQHRRATDPRVTFDQFAPLDFHAALSCHRRDGRTGFLASFDASGCVQFIFEAVQ
jgi:hypothetical protein